MKYWLFHTNQVMGPYDRDQIAQIKGFSAESLVCPEGHKGTEMGDWQRAGIVSELSEALLQGAKVAAPTHVSGTPGVLPPEPTLKDLAFLGSLQEKTQVLENALGQLREDLRSRETELSQLKGQLGERERAAAELSAKLADTQSQVAEFNHVRENINRLEGDVQVLKQIVENQRGEIQNLHVQVEAQKAQAPAVGAAPAGPAGLSLSLPPEPAQETIIQPIPAGQDLPAPIGESAKPDAIAFEVPEADRTMPLGSASMTLPGTAVPENVAEAPMGGMKAAKKMPGGKMGLIAEQESMPFVEPAKEEKAGKLKIEEPSAFLSSGGKKRSSKFIPIVIFVALTVTVVVYFLGGSFSGSSKPKPPEPQAAPKNNPPALAENLAPAASPTPSGQNPLNQGAQQIPPAPDPADVARDFAKNYKIPGTSETLDQRLEAAYPPSGHLLPWMVEKLKAEDKYQVNYYTGVKKLVYEFIVQPKAQKISAHNAPAEAVLSGGMPGASQKSSKGAKPAAKKRKAGRRRSAQTSSRRAADASGGGEAIAPAPTPTEENTENVAQSKDDEDVSIDQLLLPGVPKAAHTKKSKKKPVANKALSGDSGAN